MNCSKCNQPVDPGASFCGNCGQPIQVQPPTPAPSPISQAYYNQSRSVSAQQNFGTPVTNTAAGAVPAYAVATNVQHKGEIKALIAVICGVLGLAGALLIPLIALGFGIAGLILGTTSRAHHRRVSTIGIAISSLAILGGLGGWAYNISKDPTLQTKTSHTDPVSINSTNSLATPCFELGFAEKYQIKNDEDSCDMQAYDGLTFSKSTEIYKVYANQIPLLTEEKFMSTTKGAIEKDIKDTLPGFDVSSQGSTKFAGSPAYYVKAKNSSTGVAVIESAVLHKTDAGYNYFVLVHVGTGNEVDLDVLEALWQWK